MQKNDINWYIVLIMSFIIWGTQHPPIKVLSGEVSPLLFNFLRFSIAGLVLVPFVVKNKKKIKKEDIIKISLMGFVGIFLFGILNITGVRLSTATNNSILLNSWPLLLILMAPALVKEKVSKKAIIGVSAGFTGMVAVVTNGNNMGELVQSDLFAGNLLIILSALSIAVYSIYSKKYIQRYGGLEVTFYAIVTGAILFMLASMLTREIFSITMMDLESVMLMLWVAIPTTALTYVVYFKSIDRIGLVRTSVFFFLIPASGIFTSYLFLGEEITIYTIIGTVLILSGVYMVQNNKA